MSNPNQPLFGAHMSIAGGFYKAVEAAQVVGCQCLQVFTKNNNQWKAKPIAEADVERFETALAGSELTHPIAHASYLINLASPDESLRRKSIDAFRIELERAELLGLLGVVLHPGSYTTSTEEEGLDRIAESLNEVHRDLPTLKTRCLLENTAGQGTNLGHQFEQLKSIISCLDLPDRVGVCFDTCHAFAAGYNLGSEEGYLATMEAFEEQIGLEKLVAFHLNDSKRELGSRVDRHEHIGEGEIGEAAFVRLVNDERFSGKPMYLETPKGKRDGVDLDQLNLEKLRSFLVA